MVIAVDFDGTITKENKFPEIGEIRKNAIDVIKNLQKHDHKVFLWTCREGQYLIDAINFLESKGLFLDGYNISPYDNINNGRKAIADLYIDDRNIQMTKTGFDWKRIENIILSEKKIKAQEIENLRENFREVIGNDNKKDFYNSKYEVSFKFNKLSINKIGCIKSINQSIMNGFTAEEHFEAAENIKSLFEHAELYSTDCRIIKSGRLEQLYLFVCQITENVYAYMNVVTWRKTDGYINLYLKKEAE